jgi:hypothetical protein
VTHNGPGLHFEILDFSTSPRQVTDLRVGSVVYSGGTVAWDKILSSERRWLFEQLDAVLAAWSPLADQTTAGQWRLEGHLLPDDSPAYTLSHQADGDESTPWTPLGSWERLEPARRAAVHKALQHMLEHIQGMLTIY